MPRIYVEFAGLKEIGNECKIISTKINEIQSDFQQTMRNLDWDVKYEADINNRANQIVRKLQQYSEDLKKYEEFIENAYEEYSKLDKYKNFILNAKAINIIDKMHILGPSKEGSPNMPYARWTQNLSEFFSVSKE